ncbi:sn-glycerol-3-phosphate import ATP-binding protein UgpC [subsurface metagenome]
MSVNIRVENLFKFYETVEALSNINLEISKGEFFVLLGPSGAGKTSFIKVIAGVEGKDFGDIYFGDKLINKIPAYQRNVAVTFEAYALYAHLSVFDNMAFPLMGPLCKSKGYSPEQIDKIVHKWAKFLQIEQLLERLPQELSGGQKQRVAMGRMLVREPNVFLMDEPIAHLDAKLRHIMRAELKNIQSELNITTIYTTPDQLEALSMGDRIAVINEGKILQVGRPGDIFNNPVDEWVASFISDIPMNIASCHLEVKNRKYFAVNPYFKIALPEKQGSKLSSTLKDNNNFDLGVRPNKVSISTSEKKENSILANISIVEDIGRTKIFSLFVGDIEIFSKIPSTESPNNIKKVWIKFDEESLYYFNEKTKARYAI